MFHLFLCVYVFSYNPSTIAMYINVYCFSSVAYSNPFLWSDLALSPLVDLLYLTINALHSSPVTIGYWNNPKQLTMEAASHHHEAEARLDSKETGTNFMLWREAAFAGETLV